VQQVPAAPHQHLVTAVSVDVGRERAGEEHQVFHAPRPAREHRHGFRARAGPRHAVRRCIGGECARKRPAAEGQRNVEGHARLGAQREHAEREERGEDLGPPVAVEIGHGGRARSAEEVGVAKGRPLGRLERVAREHGGPRSLVVDERDRASGHGVEDHLEVAVRVRVDEQRVHLDAGRHRRQEVGAECRQLERIPAGTQRPGRMGPALRTDGVRACRAVPQAVRADDDLGRAIAVEIAHRRRRDDLGLVEPDREPLEADAAAPPGVEVAVERADEHFEPGFAVEVRQDRPREDPDLERSVG